MNPNENEKAIARQAAVFLALTLIFGVLLLLDLINQGLVWRALQALRSENNSTLPDEKRTVGDNTYQTDIHFLS